MILKTQTLGEGVWPPEQPQDNCCSIGDKSRISVSDAQPEDSAIYSCSVVGTEAFAAHDFEVFSK